jgi:hypothetical protein
MQYHLIDGRRGSPSDASSGSVKSLSPSRKARERRALSGSLCHHKYDQICNRNIIADFNEFPRKARRSRKKGRLFDNQIHISVILPPQRNQSLTTLEAENDDHRLHSP